MNLNIKLLNHMFSNFKVSSISKQKYSTVKFNKGLLKVLRFLKDKGYIISFYQNKNLNKIFIYLKYDNFTPYVWNIKVLIKKNKRSYLSLYKIMKTLDKNKTYVLSTKKGILFLEEAINYQIGGFILFQIQT